jgi:hypothetical protein
MLLGFFFLLFSRCSYLSIGHLIFVAHWPCNTLIYFIFKLFSSTNFPRHVVSLSFEICYFIPWFSLSICLLLSFFVAYNFPAPPKIFLIPF